MCGRYVLRRIDALRRAVKHIEPAFEEFSETKPHYNIAPSQYIPIIRDDHGKESLTVMKWGLIPGWTKEAKPKLAPINAKAETVATSGMFRQAFAKRRCLVPADGFYEWRGAKPPKQPYFIHMKDDSPFAFAGLWERWTPPESDQAIDTFTIITTEPNALMKEIHNRMPVILDAAEFDRWLFKGDRELLRPFPAERMEAYKVSTAVNKPSHDSPDCIEPLDDR